MMQKATMMKKQWVNVKNIASYVILGHSKWLFVTGFEKSHLQKIFRNTNFNYFQSCISGRKTDACM